MVTRDIRWLSGMDRKNDQEIDAVGERLSEFYRKNENYYGDIDGSSSNWVNPAEKAYSWIVKEANLSQSICEFGCGSANILRHFPDLQRKYAGCDFSKELIDRNRGKYQQAEFKVIEQVNTLPFPDREFDFVFSVFVIEHCNRPQLLLDECARVLKPGGKLVIMCPNFLGRGRMSSQRAGFSAGTSKSKLHKGAYWDALVTLFDNRVRIPLVSYLKKRRADQSPQFYINVAPTVFDDPFIPDVDAIYLTYKNEMISYLSRAFEANENDREIDEYEREKGLIFLSLTKK